YILYVYFLLFYYVLTSSFYEKKLSNLLIAILSYIVPLLLIGLKVEERILKSLFRRILKILNFIMILVTCLGLIESMLGIDIYIYISKMMSERAQELIAIQNTRDIYRLYSFMGHPLFNTQLYLMFFILNNIYNKYFEKLLSDKVLIIVMLLGISMTASKTGLILASVSVLIITYKKTKIKHIIMVIIASAITIGSGIFNNTIYRILEESLTTGRAESWERITTMNLFPIKFFTGYGNGFTFVYNQYIDWASAAFEYPIRMFSLEMGISMMIGIYICIAIIPVAILVGRRHLYLLISYAIVFLDVNTYNALSLPGDNMIIFSLFTCIILNISNMIVKRKENLA
ncbi:MAG: hypothetical protein ACLR2K_15580, partial [Paraclostridium sordellii]